MPWMGKYFDTHILEGKDMLNDSGITDLHLQILANFI